MNQNKIHLINKIFNDETIRTIWDKEEERLWETGVDHCVLYTGKSSTAGKYLNSTS